MIGRDGGLSTLCVIAAGCSFTCHKRVCKKHFLTLAISGYLLYIYNHPNKSPCIPWHLQLQVSRFCDHQVKNILMLEYENVFILIDSRTSGNINISVNHYYYTFETEICFHPNTLKLAFFF